MASSWHPLSQGKGKNKAAARAAVKNGRRAKRHGRKAWMADKPVMKRGAGGTDKGGKNNGRAVTYSDRPATR